MIMIVIVMIIVVVIISYGFLAARGKENNDFLAASGRERP